MTTRSLVVAALVGFVCGVVGCTWSSTLLSNAAVKECVEEGVVFHGVQNDVWFEGTHGPKGSCWCGKADGYCLCTPNLTVDLVTTIGDKVVFIKRAKPPYGWAIPGGYVEVGETAERAAQRELKEETNLDAPLSSIRQVTFISDPDRDPRRHSATVLFRVTLPEGVKLAHGDDAAETKLLSMEDISKFYDKMAFKDHASLLKIALKLPV